MKTEIKEKWVAALRSGEYVQGEGALKIIGKQEFCCLGVLCDLYIKDGQDGSWSGVRSESRHKDNKSELFRVGQNLSTFQYGMPPAVVYAWAGISDEPVGELAMMNDGGFSFASIADCIEEKF